MRTAIHEKKSKDISVSNIPLLELAMFSKLQHCAKKQVDNSVAAKINLRQWAQEEYKEINALNNLKSFLLYLKNKAGEDFSKEEKTIGQRSLQKYKMKFKKALRDEIKDALQREMALKRQAIYEKTAAKEKEEMALQELMEDVLGDVRSNDRREILAIYAWRYMISELPNWTKSYALVSTYRLWKKVLRSKDLQAVVGHLTKTKEVLSCLPRQVSTKDLCSYSGRYSREVKKDYSEVRSRLKTHLAGTQYEKSRLADKVILRVTGHHMTVNNILESKEFNTAMTSDVTEVQVIAQGGLFIDGSLKEEKGKNRWSGVNVALLAHEIYFTRKVLIDTSGVNGQSQARSKAANGRSDFSYTSTGGNGSHGLDGNPGQSAGHVTIKAEKIINPQYLQVRAIGGNGSDGQHGGDAEKGRNGKDGVDARDPSIGGWGVCSDYVVNNVYENGKSGGYGGDGGNGGAPGGGGNGGRILIVDKEKNYSKGDNPNYISRKGAAGLSGKPGKGGVAGYNGRHGTDKGAIEQGWFSGGYASGSRSGKNIKVHCKTIKKFIFFSKEVYYFTVKDPDYLRHTAALSRCNWKNGQLGKYKRRARRALLNGEIDHSAILAEHPIAGVFADPLATAEQQEKMDQFTDRIDQMTDDLNLMQQELEAMRSLAENIETDYQLDQDVDVQASIEVNSHIQQAVDFDGAPDNKKSMQVKRQKSTRIKEREHKKESYFWETATHNDFADKTYQLASQQGYNHHALSLFEKLLELNVVHEQKAGVDKIKHLRSIIKKFSESKYSYIEFILEFLIGELKKKNWEALSLPLEDIKNNLALCLAKEKLLVKIDKSLETKIQAVGRYFLASFKANKAIVYFDIFLNYLLALQEKLSEAKSKRGIAELTTSELHDIAVNIEFHLDNEKPNITHLKEMIARNNHSKNLQSSKPYQYLLKIKMSEDELIEAVVNLRSLPKHGPQGQYYKDLLDVVTNKYENEILNQNFTRACSLCLYTRLSEHPSFLDKLKKIKGLLLLAFMKSENVGGEYSDCMTSILENIKIHKGDPQHIAHMLDSKLSTLFKNIFRVEYDVSALPALALKYIPMMCKSDVAVESVVTIMQLSTCTVNALSKVVAAIVPLKLGRNVREKIKHALLDNINQLLLARISPFKGQGSALYVRLNEKISSLADLLSKEEMHNWDLNSLFGVLDSILSEISSKEDTDIGQMFNQLTSHSVSDAKNELAQSSHRSTIMRVLIAIRYEKVKYKEKVAALLKVFQSNAKDMPLLKFLTASLQQVKSEDQLFDLCDVLAQDPSVWYNGLVECQLVRLTHQYIVWVAQDLSSLPSEINKIIREDGVATIVKDVISGKPIARQLSQKIVKELEIEFEKSGKNSIKKMRQQFLLCIMLRKGFGSCHSRWVKQNKQEFAWDYLQRLVYNKVDRLKSNNFPSFDELVLAINLLSQIDYPIDLLNRLSGRPVNRWLQSIYAQSLIEQTRKFVEYKAVDNLQDRVEELNNNILEIKQADILRVLLEKINKELLNFDHELAVAVDYWHELIRMLANISFMDSVLVRQLHKSPLSQWKNKLRPYELAIHIRMVPKHLMLHRQSIIEALIHLQDLGKLNTNSFKKITNYINYILQDDQLMLLLEFLQQALADKFIVNNEIMDTLLDDVKPVDIAEWQKVTMQYSDAKSQQIRSLDVAIALMKDNPKNKNLDELKDQKQCDAEYSLREQVIAVKNHLSLAVHPLAKAVANKAAQNESKDKKSDHQNRKMARLSSYVAKPVDHWSLADIALWSEHFKAAGSDVLSKNMIMDHLPELVAVVHRAIELFQPGVRLRDVQLIALTIFLQRNSGLLNENLMGEISTGEGKQLIIAALAIIKAYLGEKVDVVTSSSSLAVRDVEEMSELFAIMGISVACVCDQDCHEEKVFQERFRAQVIYSDIGSIQRAILLTHFYNKDILAGRFNASSLIIDEVDRLLDEMLNTLFLSQDIAAFDHLTQLFVTIWYIVETFRQQHNSAECDVDALEQEVLKRIDNKELMLPTAILPFVKRRLKTFIKSALLAQGMNKDEFYIYDDLNDGSGRKKVAVIDKSTGVTRLHTNYSGGLQQFLRAKHFTKMEMAQMGLKAVYEAMITTMRRYQSICGLSGTLGTVQEIKVLHDLLGLKTFSIPRHQFRHFYQEPTIVCEDIEVQIEAIIAKVIEKINQQRALLIICDTIEEAKFLSIEIRKTLIGMPAVKLYQRLYSHEPRKIGTSDNPLSVGDILVTTNLSGRGTDVKITKVLEKNAGLFAIVTGVAKDAQKIGVPDLRTLDQNFGRVARNGAQGSGMLIVRSDLQVTPQQLMQLKEESVANKLEQVVQVSLPILDVKNSLFQQFSKFYQQAREQLNQMDQPLGYTEIQMDALRIHWAFCLDAIEHKLTHHIQDSSKQVQADYAYFAERMSQLLLKDDIFKFADSTNMLIKLGRFFHKEYPQNAALCYIEAIKLDPEFCEAAYLYLANIELAKGKDNRVFRRNARRYFKQAKQRIDKRIRVLTECFAIFEPLKQLALQTSQNSIANDLEQATQRTLSCYHAHLRQIGEAIGYDLSFERLTSYVDSRDAAVDLYQRLGKRNQFKNSRVSKKAHVLYNQNNQLQLFYCKPGEQVGVCFPNEITSIYVEKIIALFMARVNKGRSERELEFDVFCNSLEGKPYSQLLESQKTDIRIAWFALLAAGVLKEAALQKTTANGVELVRYQEKKDEDITEISAAFDEKYIPLGLQVAGKLHTYPSVFLREQSLAYAFETGEFPSEEILDFARHDFDRVTVLDEKLDCKWTWKNTLAFVLGAVAIVAGVAFKQQWLFDLGMDSIVYSLKAYFSGVFDLSDYIAQMGTKILMGIANQIKVAALAAKAGESSSFMAQQGKDIFKQFFASYGKNIAKEQGFALLMKGLSQTVLMENIQQSIGEHLLSDSQVALQREKLIAAMMKLWESSYELDQAENFIQRVMSETYEEEAVASESDQVSQVASVALNVGASLLGALSATPGSASFMQKAGGQIASSISTLRSVSESLTKTHRLFQKATDKVQHQAKVFRYRRDQMITQAKKEEKPDEAYVNRSSKANFRHAMKNSILRYESMAKDRASSRLLRTVVTPVARYAYESCLEFCAQKIKEYKERRQHEDRDVYKMVHEHNQKLKAGKAKRIKKKGDLLSLQLMTMSEDEIEADTLITVNDQFGNVSLISYADLCDLAQGEYGIGDANKLLHFDAANGVYQLHIASLSEDHYDSTGSTSSRQPDSSPSKQRDFTDAFVKFNENGSKHPDGCPFVHKVNGVDHIGTGFNLERSDAQRVLKGVGVSDPSAVMNGKKNLTQNQLKRLNAFCLQEAVSIAKRRLGDKVFNNLSERRKAAVVSLTYNCPALLGKNLVKYLKSGNYKKAADEILHRSNRSKHPGLQNRRKRESSLMYDAQFEEKEKPRLLKSIKSYSSPLKARLFSHRHETQATQLLQDLYQCDTIEAAVYRLNAEVGSHVSTGGYTEAVYCSANVANNIVKSNKKNNKAKKGGSRFEFDDNGKFIINKDDSLDDVWLKNETNKRIDRLFSIPDESHASEFILRGFLDAIWFFMMQRKMKKLENSKQGVGNKETEFKSDKAVLNFHHESAPTFMS